MRPLLITIIRVLFGISAALAVLFPIRLLMKPSDAFDEGPVTCPSRLYYGVECAACGLSRATMHLIHGEWLDAYYYNALSFITTPVLAFLWAWITWKCLQFSGLLPERWTIKLS